MPKLAKYYLLILLGLTAFSESLVAGKYADAMLHLGISPRITALGNAAGSLIESGDAFLYNPGNIGYADRIELQAMYVSQFGMANYNTLGLTIPVIKNLAVGLHWLHLGVDDIPLRPDLHQYDLVAQRDSARTLLENPLGSFAEKEDVIFISLGKLFRKDIDLGWQYANLPVVIPIGLNIKFLNRRIYQVTGTGIGIDLSTGLKMPLGEVMDFDWIGTLGTALLWQDVTGTPISWDTYSQDVMHPVLQWSLSFEQPVRMIWGNINLVWTKSTREGMNPAWGVEYAMNKLLALQLGVLNKQLNGGVTLRTTLAGVAVHLQYAFGNHLLGSTHRVGIQIVIP